jgi:hypothetical protein
MSTLVQLVYKWFTSLLPSGGTEALLALGQ